MHGEEFTPFSINTGLIFWTLVVFGILLALLWKLGWPALLKTVEDRERRIQQQLEEAERARAEAARLLEEQAHHRRRQGRSAGDGGPGQGRRRQGTRDPARQGAPGVRSAARAGAPRDRRREGKS